ncbi:hypothetical protein [Mycoplasma wenyonii]|nr:hypothetical protein [Mycoplasma wenyonii]
MEKKVKWVELGEICEFQAGLTANKEQMLKEKVNEWCKPLIKINNFE